MVKRNGYIYIYIYIYKCVCRYRNSVSSSRDQNEFVLASEQMARLAHVKKLVAILGERNYKITVTQGIAAWRLMLFC